MVLRRTLKEFVFLCKSQALNPRDQTREFIGRHIRERSRTSGKRAAALSLATRGPKRNERKVEYGRVAQSEEHRTFNPEAVGSSPTPFTSLNQAPARTHKTSPGLFFFPA